MAGKKKAPARWEDVPEIPRAEQPYELPEGWKWVRLGEVTDIIMGQSPEGKETTDDESYTPLIGGASDMGVLYPCSKKYTKKPTKLSTTNDVILSIRATLGRPIFSDGTYCLGRGVAAIRSPLLNRLFLRYFFINFESYLYKHAVGSTFLQISSDKLKEMPVPYPPLETQQRIAARIESLFSQLDEAAEKVQAVIDRHEARKQAILHRAFRGELTRDREVDEEDSSTDIPELTSERAPYALPKGWKWVKLSSVAKWGSGGTPSRKHPEYYAGEISWLKTGELTDSEIYETDEHITTEALNYSSAKLFPINTVIMAMYGATIGKLGILKIKAATNQACACAQCEDFIHYKYLFFYLLSQRDEFIKLGKGGAQPNISQEIIKNFLIPLPPLAIQEYIVSRIESLFSKLEPVFESGQETLEKISQLRKSVLHSAFRGKLT